MIHRLVITDPQSIAVSYGGVVYDIETLTPQADTTGTSLEMAVPGTFRLESTDIGPMMFAWVFYLDDTTLTPDQVDLIIRSLQRCPPAARHHGGEPVTGKPHTRRG